MSFRYYLYISDSKIDMLLAQIDPGLTRKRTAELSLNLKIFGAKRGVEQPAGADRIARLERVVRHLQDFGDLGSVDRPGQFFGGLLPMRWGPFYGTSLVYFGGDTGRGTVGLGGSARHVMGGSGSHDGQELARSVTPRLLDGLTADPEIGELLGVGSRTDEEVLRAVTLANAGLRGPVENVEFVAKRLLYGTVDDRLVLLGSPLYVALAD